MIVYRLLGDHFRTDDVQNVAVQIREAHARRTPPFVVVQGDIEVTEVGSRSHQLRAKRGPTPRWLRRPAVVRP